LTTPPRGTFSNYAMVSNLSTTRRGLTRYSRRRMLESSRQCRMALPPFADTANGARIRPTPTRHGIERTFKHRRLMHDDREWFVGASIEAANLGASRGASSSGSRAAQRTRSPAALHCPGLTERSRRSNHSRSSSLGA
jgi:hypothetical protein